MLVLVLVAVFAAWLAISAANQFRCGALTLRMRRHIPLGIIPLWTFFAPNPARADSRLIWREEVGGEWLDWRELPAGFGSLWRRWLVHPELITTKAIADLVNSLLRSDRVAAEAGDRTALLSSSYVTLLGIVLQQCRQDGCTAVQFAIARSSRSGARREVAVAFVSEVHGCEDRRQKEHSGVR